MPSAPHASELGVTDWTVEAWFQDGNSKYNHARTRLFTKVDITSAEVPFFASIDSNLLYVGTRRTSSPSTLTCGLSALSTGAWHHMAATLNYSTRQLTIYIDGV